LHACIHKDECACIVSVSDVFVNKKTLNFLKIIFHSRIPAPLWRAKLFGPRSCLSVLLPRLLMQWWNQLLRSPMVLRHQSGRTTLVDLCKTPTRILVCCCAISLGLLNEHIVLWTSRALRQPGVEPLRSWCRLVFM
jgi:hypothetical protein